MTLVELAWDDLTASAVAAGIGGVLLGGLLRGFTGFGLPLAAVPIMTVVMTPALAVPAMLLLQIVAGLQTLPRSYRSIHWPALAWLAVGALTGIPLGVATLALLPPDVMRLLIGLAMLLAVVALSWGLRLKHMPGVAARLGTGAIAGVLSGAAAMPGPPVVVFFLASPASAAVSRASLQFFFMLTGFASLSLGIVSGIVTWTTAVLALLLTPALMLGTWAGEQAFHRTEGRNYRPAAIAVLLAIGVLATMRALWALLNP